VNTFVSGFIKHFSIGAPVQALAPKGGLAAPLEGSLANAPAPTDGGRAGVRGSPASRRCTERARALGSYKLMLTGRVEAVIFA